MQLALVGPAAATLTDFIKNFLCVSEMLIERVPTEISTTGQVWKDWPRLLQALGGSDSLGRRRGAH